MDLLTPIRFLLRKEVGRGGDLLSKAGPRLEGEGRGALAARPDSHQMLPTPRLRREPLEDRPAALHRAQEARPTPTDQLVRGATNRDQRRTAGLMDDEDPMDAGAPRPWAWQPQRRLRPSNLHLQPALLSERSVCGGSHAG